MADAHVNIANGLKIGLKTKLALGPQFGRIKINILEIPHSLRDIREV